jgi:hypothetical protein
MTPAEYRAQCIEAQTDAFIEAWYGYKVGHWHRKDVKQAITAAFDALHGIARVVPPKATNEMYEAVFDEELGALDQFEAIAAAADLTRPPPDTDAEIAMSRRGGEAGASLDEMAEKYDLRSPNHED